MFIASLTYTKGLDEVDKHLAAHIAWLKDGYAAGMCIASGRKNPRTGGVILARGERSDVEAYFASDPFAIHGVADYEITEVTFTMAAIGLDALKD